jgi:hypothetical protein
MIIVDAKMVQSCITDTLKTILIQTLEIVRKPRMKLQKAGLKVQDTWRVETQTSGEWLHQVYNRSTNLTYNPLAIDDDMSTRYPEDRKQTNPCEITFARVKS